MHQSIPYFHVIRNPCKKGFTALLMLIMGDTNISVAYWIELLVLPLPSVLHTQLIRNCFRRFWAEPLALGQPLCKVKHCKHNTQHSYQVHWLDKQLHCWPQHLAWKILAEPLASTQTLYKHNSTSKHTQSNAKHYAMPSTKLTSNPLTLGWDPVLMYIKLVGLECTSLHQLVPRHCL